MTDPFLAAIAFTLQAEGGLVDDPRDAGGITNMGLTIADLTLWERHRGTADDVRDLTREEAVAIYRATYWQIVRGAALPAGIGLSVFDHGVNRGTGASAKILQRLVGTAVDGVIGPHTLTATTVAAYGDTAGLLAKLHDAQRDDYLALANPAFEKGWLARCDARYAAAQAAVP